MGTYDSESRRIFFTFFEIYKIFLPLHRSTLKYLSIFRFYFAICPSNFIFSSFDQGVKPIGLPKRAFSRTWRLFGGRAKSDIQFLSLSLSNVPSSHVAVSGFLKDIAALSLSLAIVGTHTAENEPSKVLAEMGGPL